MTTASIVTYNTDRGELSKVIGCLDRSTVAEVFVVDNSPTDALRAFAQGLSPKVRYVWGQGNVGYGAAHNIAMKMVSGGMAGGGAASDGTAASDFHIIVNPDIYFADGTVEALEAFAAEHPDAGLVMPDVHYPDGRRQYLCKLLPSPIDLFGRRFLPKALTRRHNERFEMRGTGYDKVMDVPYLSGCFMFLRMERAVLFDERFFMYGEDVDLSRRMFGVGRNLFCPTVRIVHDHAQASYKSVRMLWVHIRSIAQYFNKWGWFFDRERRKINRETPSKSHYSQKTPQ